MKNTVVVVRHGEKDGDKLTHKGAAEIFTMTEVLVKKYKFGVIAYSGANRTEQCAFIAAAAILPNMYSRITEDGRFHFNDSYARSLLKSDERAFNDEVETIKRAGGTIKAAIEISDYVRLSRERLTKAIIDFATDDIAVLAFSHGSYANLAVPESKYNLPYEIGTGDAIVYTVENGEIIDAELVVNPLRQQG